MHHLHKGWYYMLYYYNYLFLKAKLEGSAVFIHSDLTATPALGEGIAVF